MRGRPPRVLWASLYSLLDVSSGAALAVREMLQQLSRRGYEVSVLGASIFDHERGRARVEAHWGRIQARRGAFLTVEDEGLCHQLLITQSSSRTAMTALEEKRWYDNYLHTLATFRPDLVGFYGGWTPELLIAAEARARGIPSFAYLAHGGYRATRWCRDVDLILTDSQATADLYRERLGLAVTPVGTFINAAEVVAPRHQRECVTFVNCQPQKGVYIVAALASLLESRRQDIRFEVIESRGNWGKAVTAMTTRSGRPRETLSNVAITGAVTDMRPVYQRSRVVLAPSLGWESAGRVLAEAMLNGIPAVVSNIGGIPEVVAGGGLKIEWPANCHQPPFTTLPPDEGLETVAAVLERLFDEEAFYATLARRAAAVGEQCHSLVRNTDRLERALGPLVAKRAGDSDHGLTLLKGHRHALAEQPLEKAHARAPFDTNRRSGFAPEQVGTIVVLGAWSSGTTALVGYLARLGAFTCPPHVRTSDPRTPDSFEPQAFRDALAEVVDEFSLARLQPDSTPFKDWLHEWWQQQRSVALAQGCTTLVLKHPLTAFLIPELQAVCAPQFVVMTRAFAEIEATRQRRGWASNYGEDGAKRLYSAIFNALIEHSLDALTLDYETFRRDPSYGGRLAVWLNLQPSEAAQAAARAWVR
ncbi:MAG: glycosyltransferase family 4 protein [Chromatiaceae bacterium]|nr:glycosyltransferase family 4 protein [Chromatiaceae bacterium]